MQISGELLVAIFSGKLFEGSVIDDQWYYTVNHK